MRRITAVALVLVVALAGCAGSPGGSTATPETETSTETNSQATTATAESSNAPPDATSANTIDFGTLTERQKEAFLDALDGEVSFAPSSPCINEREDYHANDYSELVHPFRTHEYVTYEGSYYATTVATGSTMYLSKSYQLREASPGPNDTVVASENLSAENQTYIQQAIYPEEYKTPYRCASPDVFRRFYTGTGVFASYENETYAAETTLIEDAPKYLLTITEYGTSDSGKN